jgi:hypothetical protein
LLPKTWMTGTSLAMTWRAVAKLNSEILRILFLDFFDRWLLADCDRA